MDIKTDKTVKKLVIIGNGLDLHHGIRSKYKHFYNHASFPKELKAIYDILTEAFYPVERWYDFEEEYRKLIRTETEMLERGYVNAEGGLTEENKRIYMPRINLINFVFQRINCEFVNYLKNEYETAKDASVNRCFKRDENVQLALESADVIINFNYTNTIEDLYNIDSSKIVHIHGTLDGSAIIGHSNFCDYEDPKGARYGLRINYPELRGTTYKGDKNLQRIERWNGIKVKDTSFAPSKPSFTKSQDNSIEIKMIQNNSMISATMLERIYERPFDVFDDYENGYHYYNKLAFKFEDPLEITVIGHGLGSDTDLLSRIPARNKKVIIFQRKDSCVGKIKTKAKDLFKTDATVKYYSNE